MKLNVVVAGGTGSGKTTLLNVFSSIIPEAERVVTIEDSAELQLQHRHLVSLETRLPDKSGRGGIDMGDLLLSALRLRPDRIVVGEIRGAECFHFVQALNTGHGGSMCTCHANTPVDTLRRIESLSMMVAPNLPLVAVRAQIASAFGLIICCTRFPDGARRVTAISEVLSLDDAGEYRTQDLFVYAPVHREPDGTLLGYHSPTGVVPNFAEEARAFGFNDLSDEFFDPVTYGLPAPPPFRNEHAQGVRWAPSLKHRAKGLPEPDALKVERDNWEASLRSGLTKREGAVPMTVTRNLREVKDEDQPVSARPSNASPFPSDPAAPHNSFSMDQLLPRAENGASDGPAFAADARVESKVQLSPDLVAEIRNLATPHEVASPSRAPSEAAIPLPPNKDRR
jgi:pilus assembly protein CpaF